MIEALTWASDHWVFVISLELIASATYSVPKMAVAFMELARAR